VKVSVPGNILLLGEYAVLEEGGLGAAFAVERRVHLQAEPARSLSIEGVWPGGSFRWTPRNESASPLSSAVFKAVQGWLQSRGRQRRAPALRIRIDSSELFSAEGRKAGFGSSAAVAVALVAALRADGRLDAVTPRLALAGHRAAQGGAGSGYDVYCSYYGGWGMFRGGARPSWEQREPATEARLHLFSGPAPVSTRNAIQSFYQWKSREGGLTRRLVEQSNGNVKSFLAARSAREAAAAFRKARETGIALGDAIGVEARIQAPVGVDPDMCKSLGAGNELGVYLQLPGSPAPPAASGLIDVGKAACGIKWTP